MRVAFDAICLADGPITGVARAFLTGLCDYGARWPDDVIVLAPPGGDRGALPAVRIVDAPRGALRRQLQLPRLLRELAVDVVHSSVAAVPLRAPCPTIATVHDLPWLHPESGERSTWWRRFATRRALRAATAVIAPSRFTLDAAVRILGERHRDKLHLVPHATPEPTAPAGAPAARTGPFLVLGDDRPRKNRQRVRAAHALAAARNPGLPPLRFVGPPDDYVSEREKAELLSICRAVVACSLYEGFGLPVLEALAHGAPLICSDIPPHREIAGVDAALVDPRAVESIAAALAAPPPPHAPRAIEPVAPRWRDVHTSVSITARW
ncbi:MAG: glycosyltransferase [Planctomycetes bacterium]|nr:glycosyltransferase [Planctomycetota bacterium]